jgi:hypothetical protein
VAHTVHQLAQARARIGGEGVPGMTQVVEVDAGQAGLGDGGKPRAAVKVAMPQRRAHRAGEHEHLVVVRVEALEMRLSRLGVFDASLGAVRADAEADAACKTGDHGRAVRHEHLAASYRAMRDHYRQQAQALALIMADRQEWEQATAGSRCLAIAADAELRRRQPHQKIEPLRSAESVSNSEWEQTHPRLGQEISQAQQEVFRATLQSRQSLEAPDAHPGWSGLDTLFSAGRTPGRTAILQPPKPSIEPSARILQRVTEHDIEPEAGG